MEQVGQSDMTIRQQDTNGRRRHADGQPRSFEEYLASSGYRAGHPGQNAPGRESLAQLAERARTTPRVW